MTITGPYVFRKYFEEEPELTKIRSLGLTPTRQAANDGSVPVSGFVDGERTTLLWVRPIAPRKRNTPYDAPDDERDALAEKIVAALNAYEAAK
jgi:hypothetical protein